jgi:hypothetical protein
MTSTTEFLRRWATAGFVLLVSLSTLADFHVLAQGHSQAHDALVETKGPATEEVAVGCDHSRSAHVEPLRTVTVRRCLACALRSAVSVLPWSSSAAPSLPQGEVVAAPSALFVPVSALHESSRGPPRA